MRHIGVWLMVIPAIVLFGFMIWKSCEDAYEEMGVRGVATFLGGLSLLSVMMIGYVLECVRH